MVWVIVVLLVIFGSIALVAIEIRNAPEVDDSYEVYLRDYYRDNEAKERRISRQAEPPRENDAA